jgi:NmrA-like family
VSSVYPLFFPGAMYERASKPTSGSQETVDFTSLDNPSRFCHHEYIVSRSNALLISSDDSLLFQCVPILTHLALFASLSLLFYAHADRPPPPPTHTQQDKAVELSKAGAEVVALDLNKPDSLADAFAGLTGLFIVTSYWEYMDAKKEEEHVKSVIKAGEAAGIKHYIWSTLEDTEPFFDSLPEGEKIPRLSDGHYTPHLDIKGRMNAEFPKDKTTFLYTSFYLENLTGFGMVQNGVMCNNLGDNTPLPVIAAKDIGACAYGVFKAGDEYKGKDVGIAGDIITLPDLMDLISQETGKKFSYMFLDRNTCAGFGYPGADDIANMFEFKKLNNEAFVKMRELSQGKAVNPNIEDAKTWVKNNKDALAALAAPSEE